MNLGEGDANVQFVTRVIAVGVVVDVVDRLVW